MNPVLVPIRTRSTNHGNGREHWGARTARVRAERRAVRTMLTTQLTPMTDDVVVTLTRIAPRTLDDDNLRGALKACRDETAAFLGRDDNPKAGIEWRYSQERGAPRQYAVRITIERAEEAAA